MDYRIGLDIGITSVGWAVVENDSGGEPKRIADMGVRIFNEAENPKDGSSLALPRRQARCARRRLRRRKHRLDRIKALFEKEGLISKEEFMERYGRAGLPDVYRLRCEALDRLLTGEELAQALLHIAKHRGFRSTRKAEWKDEESGKVLSATSENKRLMEEKQYRTVGEMLYRDERFRMPADGDKSSYVLSTRNKMEDYKNTILRSMLVDEVNTIFERQRELGSSIAGQELQRAYLNIMESQRSFDEGPGNQADGTPSPYGGNLIERMIGNCTFEKDEQRAAKACYTAERFVLLQKLSHLRLRGGMFFDVLSLEDSQRAEVVKLAYQQEKVTYAKIRKTLELGEDYLFNDLSYENIGKDRQESIKKTEKAVFVSMTWFHAARKALGGYETERLKDPAFVDYLDGIGNILTKYKSDDSRMKKLLDCGVPEEQADKLLELNPSKFQHLSLKAMKKINPYLEQGFMYNEACKEAGYDFQAKREGEKLRLLKGKEIVDFVNSIPNPVVKRSVSQTFKVINAIILRYGSPQSVHIELAREMSKRFEERKNIKKRMEENHKSNEALKRQLVEWDYHNPTGQDLLKFRLWQEQGECCMYTGEHIPRERLFEKGVAEIDHIIPYSRSFDDSMSNKVLVKAEENQRKGNRLPFEVFGSDSVKWSRFEARVKEKIPEKQKKNKLLKRGLTEEDEKAFKARNLIDTSYITRLVYNIVEDYLEFAPYSGEGRIRKVFAVNGMITSYLRKRWGLSQKDRSTDTHHAVDACIVACCTNGMIRRITHNLWSREMQRGRHLQVVDRETGEIFNRDDYTEQQWIQMFGAQIERPWPWFNDELDFRMSPEPQSFIRNHPREYNRFGYPEGEEDKICPIFVSRMPNHKVTGAEREDTIRSPRHFEEKNIVVTRVPLTSLKLDKEGEIPNYYNPESDRLLYEALKKRLQIYGGDAKKAFADDFYKPKADGSRGPLVRKVKIWEKMTAGVFVNGGKGIAANGDMIRVDIFRVNGKYYLIPIYVSDVAGKELPNKAVVAHKPFRDWKEMKEEDFIFSLYPNDLMFIRHKQGISGKTNTGAPCVVNDQFAYFRGADISTASISAEAHDRSFSFRGLGIQSLVEIRKYQVGVLGNDDIQEIKKEKRMYFRV